MIDCSVGSQSDRVDADPLPELNIFRHRVSFHFALHFNVEDLQCFSSCCTSQTKFKIPPTKDCYRQAMFVMHKFINQVLNNTAAVLHAGQIYRGRPNIVPTSICHIIGLLYHQKFWTVIGWKRVMWLATETRYTSYNALFQGNYDNKLIKWQSINDCQHSIIIIHIVLWAFWYFIIKQFAKYLAPRKTTSITSWSNIAWEEQTLLC